MTLYTPLKFRLVKRRVQTLILVTNFWHPVQTRTENRWHTQVTFDPKLAFPVVYKLANPRETYRSDYRTNWKRLCEYSYRKKHLKFFKCEDVSITKR